MALTIDVVGVASCCVCGKDRLLAHALHLQNQTAQVISCAVLLMPIVPEAYALNLSCTILPLPFATGTAVVSGRSSWTLPVHVRCC